MNKIIWIIVIIAVIAVGYWLWNSKWDQPGVESVLPQLPEVSEEDSTAAIQQDLEQIDLGDIEGQFQNIDAELNNL